MTKAELQKEIGQEMSEEFYEKVMDHARRKQSFLINRGEDAASEDWYFNQLVVEAYKAKSLSMFTMQLGVVLAEIEKEHSDTIQSALNS